jgi:hypothetical protein
LYFVFFCLNFVSLMLFCESLATGSSIFGFPSSSGIQADPISAASKAPEADEGQDGDDAKDSGEDSGSTSSPPPANSEEQSLERKRTHLDDLTSSSTSIPKDASSEPTTAKASDLEVFDALDS